MARQDRTRKPTTQSAKPTTQSAERPEEQDRERPGWADEAAMARTADDPRAMAPHDRAGRPSTGDTR